MEAMREVFGKALADLGSKDERIVVLDGDLAGSTKVSYFWKQVPERFFEVGNAEQNMVGLAAGLALVGKIPFVSTFAVFASKRACDQVSISVAYQNLPVKIIGAYAGILSGNNGATHQAIEDIAIMRALPNMVVVEPGDAAEMRKALPVIVNHPGPVYLRLNRDAVPDFFPEDREFVLGRSEIIHPGKDATIIAAGAMTTESLSAAKLLADEGIDVRLINLSSIKPIDVATIVQAAEETGVIVTVENHNIYGGIGSAVAEVLVENRPVPMQRVGLRDTWGRSGSNADLLREYGMSARHIADAVKGVLLKKRG